MSGKKTQTNEGKKLNNKGGKVTVKANGKLNSAQMATVEFVRKLSDAGILKSDFYFYKSERGRVEVDGKVRNTMVFTDDIGSFKAGQYAPNGMYEQSNGDIYLDLNAGDSGEGLTIYTLAHELGHHVADTNADAFKVLTDMISEEYGEDFEYMVQEKLDLWKRLGRTNVKYMDAVEDVVCDALEPMFTNGDLANKIAKYSEGIGNDKGLLKTLKDFFDKLLTKIRNWLSGVSPTDTAAIEMMKRADLIEKVSDVYAKALAESRSRFNEIEAIAESMPVESTESVDPAEVAQYSYRSFAEAIGFEAYEDHETGVRYFTAKQSNERIKEVTEEQIKNSPVGALIAYSASKKYITSADMDKQIKMFAAIGNMCIKQ